MTSVPRFVEPGGEDEVVRPGSGPYNLRFEIGGTYTRRPWR